MVLLAGTRFGWERGADGSWRRVARGPRERPLSAQGVLMAGAEAREERR
jgi:hypothetical protein